MTGEEIMSPSPDWEFAITATLERLRERAPEIATETQARIREEYPSYAAVSAYGLECSCRRNVELGFRVLRERRRATSGELSARAAVAAERVTESVPVEDMLSAFSSTMGIIRDHFLTLAVESGATARGILEATTLLWQLAEDLTGHLAIVHHDAELERARHSEARKDEFLRRLLLGTVDGGELNRRAASFGLQLTERYHAVRARVRHRDDRRSLAALVHALERPSGSPRPGLVGIVDGEVLAALVEVPTRVPAQALAGVGHLAHLTAMGPSFTTATRIVEIGERFAMTGVHTLVDVATEAAVADEPEIGDLLVQRYLEPLSGSPEFRLVIEETLRIFFANGLNLKRTARILRVHPNTVRSRLARYEQAVGVDFSDTEVLFRVWWALERARIRDPEAESGRDCSSVTCR